MRGFTKICLLISLVFVCIGVLCLSVGMALGSGLQEVWIMAENGEFNVGSLHIGGFNIPYILADIFWDEDLDIEECLIQENFLAQDVKNLDIDIKYGHVYVTDSDTDQIEISVDAPKNCIYQCRQKDKTVELLDKTSRHRWNMLKAGLQNDVEITIAIPPQTEFDNVYLTTDAGGIEVIHHITTKEGHIDLGAGDLTAEAVAAEGKFSVDVGAGALEIAEFTAESLQVECSVGRAKLCGTVSKEVEAECSVGQIVLKLTGEEEDYDYEISCDLGNISINGKNYNALSGKKEIDHHAGRKIELNCSVGEIDVTVEEEN